MCFVYTCACENLVLSAVDFNGMWNTRVLIKSKHSGRFDYSFGSQGILSRNWLAKKWLRKLKKTHHFIQQHLHKHPRMNGSHQHDCLQKSDIILSQFIVHVSITFESRSTATLSAMKAIQKRILMHRLLMSEQLLLTYGKTVQKHLVNTLRRGKVCLSGRLVPEPSWTSRVLLPKTTCMWVKECH